MLVNRSGSCWWLRLAWPVATLCLILLNCSMAQSQEESSSAEPAEVSAIPSDEGTPVVPTEAPAVEQMPGEPPESAPSEPDSQLFPLTDEPEDRPSEADRIPVRETAMRMLIWLLVVIAMICVFVLVLKRVTGGGAVFPDQRLGRVIGRIYLSPKAVLYLVKVGDRVLVIGTTPTTMSLISEISHPEIVGEMERTRPEPGSLGTLSAGRVGRFIAGFGAARQTGEQEVKFEEYLRDIKGQMEKLNALIGGSEDEEEL